MKKTLYIFALALACFLVGALLALTCSAQTQIDYPTQIARGPSLDPRTFAFTRGGISVSAGSTSVTLARCPAGVNPTDVAHYLYLSGGTGTAEAVLITGGSVSGTGCTLSFTAAYAHSGAVLRSASGGIQEALQFGGVQAGVMLPCGTTFLQAPMSFTAPYQSMTGCGRNISFIAGPTSGPMIVDNGWNFVTMQQFGTYRQSGYAVAPTSGATIGIYGAAYVQVTDVYLRQNYNAIDTLGTCVSGGTLGNCSLVFIKDLYLEAVANEGIIGLQGTIDGLYFNANGPGGYTATYIPQDFLLIQFGDGTRVTNVIWGGVYTRSTIYFNVPNCTGCRAGLLTFSVMQTDGWVGGPAVLFGGASGYGAGVLNFDNCDWSTSNGNANPVFRVNTELSSISVTNSKFVNMQGKVFDGGGDAAGITNLIFSGNQMVSIAGSEAALTMNNFGIGIGLWTFTNNNFYVGSGTTPTYDLEFLAAAQIAIANNNFGVYSVAPMRFAVTPASIVIGLNNFVDNNPIALTAASTITLTPGFPTYIISGTTSVNAILGLYEGQTVTLLTNTGPVTFNGSSTIGNTITSTVNVPVVGRVISGRLYLHQ